MECLDYCLRCFQDVSQWETLAANEFVNVVRCPFCRAIHTIYQDGTVRLQT